MNVLLLVYYIGLLVSVTNSCQEVTTFVRDDDFRHNTHTLGKLETFEIPIRAECATKCAFYENCISFFYHHTTKKCQLNSVIYLSTDGITSNYGTKYYRQQLECPSNPQTVAHSTPQFDVSKVQTTAGTELIYACDSGYVQQGKVICQVNGVWTTTVCLRDCLTPPSIPHSYAGFDLDDYSSLEGSVLLYLCSSGYAKEGNVTCQTNGEWTTMVCIRECPVPPTIPNTVEQFNRTTVARTEGTQLTYDCSTGYVPGPEGLVTCQASGTWTAKRCLILCPAAPNIAHATAVSTTPRIEGTELEYSCDIGYLRDGQVKCQTNGTWTTMTCVRTCPTPTDVNIKQDPITPGPFVVGDILTMACVGAYIAIDLKNKITCQADGTWTSMGCNRIKTCADVKLCSSSYGDADYWMYPPAYGSQRVKIYCHHLSGTPSEFVSLTSLNTGVFPYLTNMNCNGEKTEACSSDALFGKTSYSKIKVSATTMVVDRVDSTFGDTVFGATQKYGEANDCYSIHYSNTRASCGPKGTFNIDLSNTGLIVDPNLEFKYFGWNHWGEAVRSAANVKINLLCGGWGGGCTPIGDMRLLFDAAHVPSEGAATVPKCVYP